MANISKVKLPDNTTYDVISMQTRSVIFCRPAVTSTASAFKVNVPSIPSLYNGLSLYIYNNIAASVANATLELNNFGAKSIKINGGADDVGNYWRYERAYLFVFDSVTNRWVMNYTDIDTVSLTQAQYDALVTAGTVDPNVTYYITDRNNTTPTYAAGIVYDNTESGMVATDVQEAIDELSSIITTSTDSVTGTKWTVKKYSNGDMEIWGNKNYTPDSDIRFTAWGTWYGVTFTPGTYPETFYSIPCVVGQVQIENVGGVSSIQATPSVSAAPQITVVRPTAATISTTFHINICVYAKGRWKA